EAVRIFCVDADHRDLRRPRLTSFSSFLPVHCDRRVTWFRGLCDRQVPHAPSLVAAIALVYLVALPQRGGSTCDAAPESPLPCSASAGPFPPPSPSSPPRWPAERAPTPAPARRTR